MSQANTIQPYVVDSFNQQMIPASAYTLNNAVSWCGTTGQQQMWIKVSWHLLIDRKNGNKPKLIRVRDRLKNTLKPMKWNIFHFSLDPPPSQKWNSVLLLASFYDGKHKHEANSFLKKWNSDHEIASPLPPSEKYFTSLASRYFWDGPLRVVSSHYVCMCLYVLLSPWCPHVIHTPSCCV